ncbi:Uncharacterised protein [Mycobacteroides abscessus subsp. abscessus]|uniref:hypothetical protein n=1 Tax=Mycobacteroides abscessus TaxID=36809 RepID=UPI0009A5C199|nr:hypothetical protein [Mycobacteroides abscessus]SLH96912.1 Uncharacterised protein [Mycobacteroides abscessus subsp. abscessus]
MKIKMIGAAVGVAAVLVFPVAACGSGTPPAVTVTATPSTTYSSAPCPPITDPTWEACVDSHRAQRSAESSRSISASATAAAQAQHSNQAGGIPWWVWVLGTIAAIAGLVWWGTTLDDGTHSSRYVDDDDDDDDEDEEVLIYPAIPVDPVSEPIPYPEEPIAPVQPASSASLMDRLGGGK